MKNNDPSNKNSDLIHFRKQKFVTCSHCWTEQRTERAFCYRCGARFFYLAEEKRRTAPDYGESK